LRIAKSASIVAAFFLAAGGGVLSGLLFAYGGDLPQITALDNYSPSTITRVYAQQGQLIGEFATQRRVVVSYDEINPLLYQAILATEDTDFERHFGINVRRIIAATLTDVIERRRAQGASTLTQQLARNLKSQFGLTSKSQETFAGRSDREAVHEEGNLRDLLQSDVSGARRLRRRGRLSSVFQQAEQTADAR
jgi:membrane carboxypeptidase/penicillin-binding protein